MKRSADRLSYTTENSVKEKPVTNRQTKEDLDRAAENYRLLAGIILNIKGTALAQDASFMSQLEELRNAMAEYSKQVQRLSKAICDYEPNVDVRRPVLRLVKR